MQIQFGAISYPAPCRSRFSGKEPTKPPENKAKVDPVKTDFGMTPAQLDVLKAELIAQHHALALAQKLSQLISNPQQAEGIPGLSADMPLTLEGKYQFWTGQTLLKQVNKALGGGFLSRWAILDKQLFLTQFPADYAQFIYGALKALEKAGFLVIKPDSFNQRMAKQGMPLASEPWQPGSIQLTPLGRLAVKARLT